jgi:small GTP-binding protein
MSLQDTPRANQLHIGIFGKRNSGKSTLINAITGHNTALVSDVAGTTTDPVYKTMEIYGLGPCVLIDTAGFDDVGELGQMRVEKTKAAMLKTDIH